MPGPFGLIDGHEQIVYGNDASAGLRCMIAIHSTDLGPALGGTRFFPYKTEQEALADVLRLSRAMTYKASCAGLDLGGGKAVIIGNPATDKNEALLRSYGRLVESLGGRYVTACDVGTTPPDLSIVRRETRWATGADAAEGGSGDSAVLTAYGTFVGIQACLERVFDTDMVRGRHVAIQGVGKVGGRLAGLLFQAGARLSIADAAPELAEMGAERYKAEIVAIDKIHAVDAEVFSPNALGGIISPTTVDDLQCRIVAGAANNQLLSADDGEALAAAGILYAPDFVINAGGLIQVADELHPEGFNPDRVRERVDQIGPRLHQIFDEAARSGVSNAAAADRLAELRIKQEGNPVRFRLPGVE
ncbi:MAG: Glu/Leu/Phe/Val family dehydrogenase [Acidimicrobiia bacterium]